jgi:hypothetical protein
MHSISIFTTYPMMVCNSSPNTTFFFFKANDHPPIPLCGKYFGQYDALTCYHKFSLIPQNLIHPSLNKDRHLSPLYYLEVDHMLCVLATSLQKLKSWFSCTT